MFMKVFRQGVALSFAWSLAAGLVFAQAQAPAAPAAQQKAEQTDLPPAQSIIDRHIEAVGGRDAMKAHNSVTVKGSMSVPANGMSGSLELFAARPNKRVTKMTLAGIGEISEGFDGTVAWSTSPMTGPMLATGDELKEKALDADFDGMLGLASKYEAMKTIEKTTFEGRPVYKIALTRKGGGDDIEFYDVETGLKAGGIVERKSPMGTVSATSVISDYKRFGGILQPTLVKQTAMGAQIVTTITSVEYDKVDPTVFELPAEIKALVK
jgi:hypothetical protein